MRRSFPLSLVIAGCLAAFAAACGSSKQPGAGAGGDAGTGAAGGARTQTVGTSGGSVTLGGVTLTIPPGALSADASLSVSSTAAPGGYTLASAAYQFGPAGTTFAHPITVTIPLTSGAAGVHLFWSNAVGGFDDLGGTVSGSMLTGQVSHFSVGFAGVPSSAGGAGGVTGTFGAATSTASGASDGASLAYQSAKLTVPDPNSKNQPSMPRLYWITLGTWPDVCQDAVGANGSTLWFTFQLPDGVNAPPAGTYAVGDPGSADARSNPMGISVGSGLVGYDASCKSGNPGQLVGAVASTVTKVMLESADTNSATGAFDVRYLDPHNQVGAVSGSFTAQACTNTGASTCAPGVAVDGGAADGAGPTSDAAGGGAAPCQIVASGGATTTLASGCQAMGFGQSGIDVQANDGNHHAELNGGLKSALSAKTFTDADFTFVDVSFYATQNPAMIWHLQPDTLSLTLTAAANPIHGTWSATLVAAGASNVLLNGVF